MDYINNLHKNIIQEIAETKDKMIFDAFELCGFNKNYLMSHSSEFEVLRDPVLGYEKYLRLHDHLFTFKIEWNPEKNVTEMVIEFCKERKGVKNE